MASRLVVKEIVGLAAVFENVSVDQAGHDIIYSLALVNPPVKPPLVSAPKKRAMACVNSRQPSTVEIVSVAHEQFDRKVPAHPTSFA
jgi:hypothetical protein